MHTAAVAAADRRPAPTGDDDTALPLRHDTFLGVCEALGQDFGFHPNILRIALCVGVLWSPLAMAGAYLAVGAIVLVSRLAFPRRRATATPQARALESAEAPAQADEELPLAA